MKHILKNIRFMIGQCWSADHSFLFVTLLIYALRVLTPLSGVLGLKLIFDALTNKAPFENFIGIIFLYCTMNIIKGLADTWYNNSYLPVASVRISEYLDIRLMNQTTALNLDAFDDAEFFDKYIRAKNEITTRATDVVRTICDTVGCAISIFTLSAVIFTVEPILLVCIAAGVAISFLIDTARSKLFYQCDRETTKVKRQIDYIRRVFYEPQYLTELRLFDVKKLGMKKYTSYTDTLKGILHRQGKKKTLLSSVIVLLESGIFTGFSLLFLGWKVWNGILSIGDFSAMFSAVFSFGGELYAFVSKFPDLYRHSLFIDNLQEVMNRRGSIECGGTLTLHPNLPHTIEFQDVSFSYKIGHPVLEHINMKIAAGEKIAIVGYNGAGKSTLFKLLCRLYDPQNGKILIDGIDIRQYTTRSLRQAFGVVMQDFHHYAFTIAENVNPQGDCSIQDIQSALLQADLGDKIKALPSGIESPLTREFEQNGVMMSGGEFQKLSLARASIHQPHVLILDEVTSALDPMAEEKLNETFLRNTKDKTVIFISHRLSSAKYADHIFMFEQGRIKEHGTHEQLMQKCGSYAELFRIQAVHYANDQIS